MLEAGYKQRASFTLIKTSVLSDASLNGVGGTMENLNMHRAKDDNEFLHS